MLKISHPLSFADSQSIGTGAISQGRWLALVTPAASRQEAEVEFQF